MYEEAENVQIGNNKLTYTAFILIQHAYYTVYECTDRYFKLQYPSEVT